MNIFELFTDFEEEQISLINKTFEIFDPVLFSELPLNSLFMVSNTKKLNKYFTVKRKEGEFPPVYIPIVSPIICLKEGDTLAVEKMTDYPVPSFRVENINEYVYPCRLKRTHLDRKI